MKKQNLRTITGAFLTGICLFYGSNAVAGSVTLAGTTGTNSTYIVVPAEYEGKEGQFVATATSSNQTTISYGQPYISGEFAYVKVTQKSYSGVTIQITPPGMSTLTTSSYHFDSLPKGSYSVTLRQQETTSTTSYSLYKNYWADTEEETFSDMLYYVKNGTLPAESGMTINISPVGCQSLLLTLSSMGLMMGAAQELQLRHLIPEEVLQVEKITLLSMLQHPERMMVFIHLSTLFSVMFLKCRIF